MTEYSFQEEDASVVINEGYDLLNEHYKEIAKYQDIELKPDFDVYLQAEKNGALKVYTVRAEDNSLQGYAVFFARANPHYKDSIQAVQDVVFIRKEHRGFGGAFIQWCDEQLAEAKVQAVYHHVKAKHNWGPMLERMGYELADLVYVKRLD